MKMALSQIKLFIVRLLQNYTINKANSDKEKKKQPAQLSTKIAESIETKDVFFCGPVNNIEVAISKRKNAKTFTKPDKNFYSLNE